MLIHKKRGLGAGKVNAPGGKIEAGETALAAAIRETEEEIMATPLRVSERGEVRFQFTDGYSLHCTLFRAEEVEGEPSETDEATPFWALLDAIPYDEMWEDDRHWLPHMLAGHRIAAWFVFDGEKMLSQRVEVGPVIVT